MDCDPQPPPRRLLFQSGFNPAPLPEKQQQIDDRQGESKHVVKRLVAIVEDHRQAALPLKVKLRCDDLSFVIAALRDHAKGGLGKPVSGARDEIHGYCLNRLFDELVEEPSNILFTTKIGPDTIRYEAMNAGFWLECLDLLEETLGSSES